MRLPILIQPITTDASQASIRPRLTVDALGATRDQGLARLREAIERRLAEGSFPVLLEIVTDGVDPWRR